MRKNQKKLRTLGKSEIVEDNMRDLGKCEKKTVARRTHIVIGRDRLDASSPMHLDAECFEKGWKKITNLRPSSESSDPRVRMNPV